PARVREDQPAMGHQGDEGTVALRGDQTDVLESGEEAAYVLLDVGVEVDRIDEEVIGEAACERCDRFADLLDPVSEVLTPMSRDQDHRPRRPHASKDALELPLDLPTHLR